jgi:hypothetical protein
MTDLPAREVQSMPDQPADSNFPSFLLFEKGSFLGLEGVIQSRWAESLNLSKRILFAVLATWVPMVILAAVQGLALGPTRSQSFLLDPAMYARFLVALPVLFFSQEKATAKLGQIVDHFLKAKLVKEAERDRFIANVVSAMRRRYSLVADWLLFAIAYAYSALYVFLVVPVATETWRTVDPEGHHILSLAGWWFVGVSQPIYSFVLLRFLYRIGVWWNFLRQTSHLDLQLDAAHPDLAGGLGFLGLTLAAFKEAAFAISASLAGAIANLVLLTGARVTSFKYEILVAMVIIVALFAGPLSFFYNLLLKAKLRGILDYWVLWHGQSRQFGQRWMHSPSEYPDMLSVPDFSQATDLSSILERVNQIKLVPIRRTQILTLIVSTLSPFLLVLTLEFPVDEILKHLLRMAF